LGLIFVLVVLFLPRGLAGLAHDAVAWVCRDKKTPQPLGKPQQEEA
jgi:urea transport system permease protein